jgi:hypothetical protein
MLTKSRRRSIKTVEGNGWYIKYTVFAAFLNTGQLGVKIMLDAKLIRANPERIKEQLQSAYVSYIRYVSALDEERRFVISKVERT